MESAQALLVNFYLWSSFQHFAKGLCMRGPSIRHRNRKCATLNLIPSCLLPVDVIKCHGRIFFFFFFNIDSSRRPKTLYSSYELQHHLCIHPDQKLGSPGDCLPLYYLLPTECFLELLTCVCLCHCS